MPAGCEPIYTLSLMRTDEIVAAIVAVSFAAGLNLYATIATLGLLARTDVIELPAQLGLLANEWVIGVSLALFALEFVADKIPGADLIWNALQTVVRVPAAALLAWYATAPLSLQAQVVIALASAGIALAAHGGKLAVRAAVTPSPEPVSNASLSLAEDAAAVGLTWFATSHPFLAAGIVVGFLAVVVLLIRWVVRALRRSMRGRAPGGPMPSISQ